MNKPTATHKHNRTQTGQNRDSAPPDWTEQQEEEAQRVKSAKVSAFIKKGQEVKFLNGLKLWSSQRSLDSANMSSL